MSRRSRRVLAVTLPVLCSLAITASADASKVYVSSNAPVVPGGRSCAQPAFNSVQAAIGAAGAGGTVEMCPGTYTEQISIIEPVKLTAVSGIGTAKLVMPAGAGDSTSACDTKEGLQQIDEISICTSGSVSITGIAVEAIIPLETCAGGLNAIFVGGGGTLKANGVTVDGASTSLNAYKGCQHGIAIEVGAAAQKEIGHAALKNVTVSGYEKNGPTVKYAGSTLTVTGSTITGEGPSPWIAQNGIEVAYGGQGTIKSSTVTANECDVASCGAEGEQASGVLFYQAAPGSTVGRSSVNDNDLGVYYASGSASVPASAEVTILKDLLTSNRYEGIDLEEGKASLNSDTINGSGRVGIDLYQYEGQLSASESTASSMKISGQSEAAIKVESDKLAGDPPGKFVITKSTETGNGSLLINDSNDFEVVF